jgi:hypothetical protein
MQDLVAYMSFISKGVPNGEHMRNEGMPKMPKLVGDSGRGRGIFVNNCARCHQQRRLGHGDRSGALGTQLVQHWRIDGAAGTRGVVHQKQHAARPPRRAHRIRKRSTSPPS